MGIIKLYSEIFNNEIFYLTYIIIFRITLFSQKIYWFLREVNLKNEKFK